MANKANNKAMFSNFKCLNFEYEHRKIFGIFGYGIRNAPKIF